MVQILFSLNDKIFIYNGKFLGNTYNAYIYWSSYRRTPGTGKVYKGQTVTTYGAAYTFKNGKKYYRISGCSATNKRYIKQANF